MKTYGIDSENSLFYERVGGCSYGILQQPTALPLSFINVSNDGVKADVGRVGPGIESVDFVFFNDGYEPTTRIRRGRIYEANPNRPVNWNSSPHPLLSVPRSRMSSSGTINHQVHEFKPLLQGRLIELAANHETLICLGNERCKTSWRLIDLEVGLFGESMVYLKARGTFGSLPLLLISEISNDACRRRVSEKYEQLKIELFSASPDSVIDRCRELATATINAYLYQHDERKITDKALDLGKLVKPLGDGPKLMIAANSADTIAKLHSRSKHTEQANRGVRSNTEMDAQLCILLVSTILVEFQWAIWE